MSNDDAIELDIVKWAADEPCPAVETFLKRPAFDAEAERTAMTVLDDVRTKGDKALLRCIRQFDGAALTAEQLHVSKDELQTARGAVDADFRNAAGEAHQRISRFARSGLKKDWVISTKRGGKVGEQFVPFGRVGVYIPGGAAPLVSTALMTVTLAKVAGVREIVACTPCGAAGVVNPFLLYALELAGTTEIVKAGGIQAIGAMAYGTESVERVEKIVGPGGPYVTAAKRCVYGTVALDLVAGPSEIAVLADETAKASHVAADLLSQAEHGSGHEKLLFVTSCQNLAKEVRSELLRQAETLERRDSVRDVLRRGTLLAHVNLVDEGMELCNRFAPEHLEIMVKEPYRWLQKVRCAGAVFVGPWSPEVIGDFVAGPSHVLPTGGSAASFSGLTVDDFRRRQSTIAFTRADLQDALPIVEAFGRVEGFDAHVRSARARFGEI